MKTVIDFIKVTCLVWLLGVIFWFLTFCIIKYPLEVLFVSITVFSIFITFFNAFID